MILDDQQRLMAHISGVGNLEGCFLSLLDIIIIFVVLVIYSLPLCIFYIEAHSLLRIYLDLLAIR
jgi:hypothetical protein